MHKLDVDFEALPNLLFHEHAEALGFDLEPGRPPRPRLLPYHPVSHGMAFPHPPAGLASVALVPLIRNRRLIGSLNLGSRDPSRFTPLLGTDFVEHMGSIIAICLENVISNEMLKYIGLTDALTGVYNRRYMDRRLAEEIARARRQSYRIACMYIDVDHFKQVNDSHGHQAGDDVLREVAARIKAELRMSDALGRFGGEEFVVLLIDADLDSADIVAQRIRASVADRPFLLPEGQGLSVTVSIGVAALEDFEREHAIEEVAQELVAQADGALYQAKHQGRNRVVSG
jgi:diguanylate cyclase (GGDEF)-like protein